MPMIGYDAYDPLLVLGDWLRYAYNWLARHRVLHHLPPECPVGFRLATHHFGPDGQSQQQQMWQQAVVKCGDCPTAPSGPDLPLGASLRRLDPDGCRICTGRPDTSRRLRGVFALPQEVLSLVISHQHGRSAIFCIDST